MSAQTATLLRLAPAAAPRVRVLMLLGSLSGGGAERVAVNLLNRCDPEQVNLHLGLLRRAGPYLAEIDPDLIEAPAERGVLATIMAPVDIARMVRRVQPQVLMSFGMGVDMLTWLALKGMGRERPRWICREDSNPAAEIDNLLGNRLGRAMVAAARRRLQRKAAGVVAVARDLAGKLDSQLGVPARVIYNPIDVATITRMAAMEPAVVPMRPYIVAAGRLVHQKGYDVLIKAFADCPAARGLDLVILGEGPLEEALKRQAAELGVGARVIFPGFQTNPWAWFARARLFVLSSRWEGFGNVVAEAMACGAPTLVSDCDYGPREQVEHGVSGWVVRSEDAAALAQGLENALTDPAAAAAIAEAGRRRARAFDIDTIADAYTRLFLEQALEPA